MKQIIYINALLMILIGVSSCTNTTQENTASPNKAQFMDKQEDIKKKRFMEFTVQQANEHYGEALETDRFKTKDGLPEFRQQLYNVLEEGKDYDVFESTWTYRDSSNITVWYLEDQGNWKPIHSFEWKKGMEF